MTEDPTGEVTELLQQLIRNACVNDGTPESGHERRSVDVLQSYLEGVGLDMETFEGLPGRTSLVARIQGTDPSAPTLMLMGHTDVVPANPDGWRRDPYGGELIDGEVWGRGATDMLNLTTSMAVATRRLAASGFKPKGSLVYLAVADEEALGTWGAKHLVEREADAVATDYVITEGGGSVLETPGGRKVVAAAGEKGAFWCRLTVSGTPSHASRPLRTDNALIKAAELVTRIASYKPETQISDIWRRYIEGMGYEPDIKAALLDPERVWQTAHDLPHLALARTAHACTHTTFAPTIVRGGSKTNVIPDRVELEIDIRTLPGQNAADIKAMLDEIIGDDLRDCVTIEQLNDDESTASPMATPLWEAMERAAAKVNPGVQVVPALMAGATDARFFRRAGVTSYGFGMMSGRIPVDQLVTMFHGDNERIDLESLRLVTEMWEGLVRDFVG